MGSITILPAAEHGQATWHINLPLPQSLPIQLKQKMQDFASTSENLAKISQLCCSSDFVLFVLNFC